MFSITLSPIDKILLAVIPHFVSFEYLSAAGAADAVVDTTAVGGVSSILESVKTYAVSPDLLTNISILASVYLLFVEQA